MVGSAGVDQTLSLCLGKLGNLSLASSNLLLLQDRLTVLRLLPLLIDQAATCRAELA